MGEASWSHIIDTISEQASGPLALMMFLPFISWSSLSLRYRACVVDILAVAGHPNSVVIFILISGDLL